MDGWTCPDCERLFARARQSHECEPGLSLDEYFATGPPHEREIYEAVMAHVTTLGDVHPDIVSVGIFLKNPHTFASLRPMRRWEALGFGLRRVARHRTIVRTVTEYHGRYWHVANVAAAGDVDDALRELLTEAYHVARD